MITRLTTKPFTARSLPPVSSTPGNFQPRTTITTAEAACTSNRSNPGANPAYAANGPPLSSIVCSLRCRRYS
jgi:hypothetical protein